MKQRIIIGPTARSRCGCLRCRKRKKKCDETHPICGYCRKKHLSCIWSSYHTKSSSIDYGNVRKSQKLSTLAREGNNRMFKSKMIIMTPESVHAKCTRNQHKMVDQYLHDYPAMDESQMVEANYLSDKEILAMIESGNTIHYLKPTVTPIFMRYDTLCNITPSSFLFKELDTTAGLFLNHYIYYIAGTLLNIGNNRFFVNYVLCMAQQNQTILSSLVGWGALFLLGRQNSIARAYFNKCLNLVSRDEELMKLKDNRNINSCTELLTLYNILMGAEISTGDVSSWYNFLIKGCRLLREYGGASKFISNSVDQRGAIWNVSNILYHDTVGSLPLTLGPPLHKRHWIALSNDLDPFQGLCQGLFALLGDIENEREKLRGILNPLERHTKLCESFKRFDYEIKNAKPNNKTIVCLRNEGKIRLLQQHMSLFKLIQYSLLIWLKITLKELPVYDSSIQSMKPSADKLFNQIVGTPSQSLLCLPMLMLGLASVTGDQRNVMSDMCIKYMRGYQIKNVVRCWEIIQESWIRSTRKYARGSEHCINWENIIFEFGWNCCFA